MAEGVGEVLRWPGRAIFAQADVGVVGLADAEPEQLLGLLDTVPSQLVHDEGGGGDSPRAPALRRLLASTRLRLLDAGGHRHATGVEGEAVPTESRHLGPAETAEGK